MKKKRTTIADLRAILEAATERLAVELWESLAATELPTPPVSGQGNVKRSAWQVLAEIVRGCEMMSRYLRELALHHNERGDRYLSEAQKRRTAQSASANKQKAIKEERDRLIVQWIKEKKTNQQMHALLEAMGKPLALERGTLNNYVSTLRKDMS